MTKREFILDLIFKIVISILIIVTNCIMVFHLINGEATTNNKIVAGISLVLGFLALCWNGAVAVRNYYHIEKEE